MTRRWWRNAEPLYRRFAHAGRDAAEAEEMFRAETYGDTTSLTNRYAAGKRNMDATVSMWREDLRAGMLAKFELIEDPTFRGIGEWLSRVLDRLPPSDLSWAHKGDALQIGKR